MGWLTVPRDWIASFGEIGTFCARVVAHVLTGRVLRFFGESLRQAGILIVGSTMVIWGLVFITGLGCGLGGAAFHTGAECGIQGASQTQSTGTPASSGVFSAWCDLRELVPYAFGY